MELIDTEILRQLEDDTSAEIVSQLLGVFCEEATGSVETALACTAAGDLDGAAGAAHSLKSAAATFGAPEVQAMAKSLEQASRAGDRDLASARSAELDRITRASLELLRAYARLER